MTHARHAPILLASVVVASLVGCGESATKAVPAAQEQTQPAGEAAFMGTWRNIKSGGMMTITDNGNNVMVRDDHRQTFTGTIDQTGDLQTSIMVKMSIDRSTGHLVWINGEYESVKK